MVKIMMHGCNGVMGQVISKIVEETEGAVMACGVDRVDDGHNDYPVFTDINACDTEVDAIIDFSAAPAVDGLLDFAVERQIPVVLCTTGLSDEQIASINEASKSVAILRSANMSLGINTLFKLLQDAAKVFASAGFDIEIVEKHHNQKIDAPSGTALMLADALASVRDGETQYMYDRHAQRKKREKSEIGIHSVRGGTIVGEHEVIFAGNNEVITLSHSAQSKELFAVGAVNAAVFMSGKGPGLYDMSALV